MRVLTDADCRLYRESNGAASQLEAEYDMQPHSKTQDPSTHLQIVLRCTKKLRPKVQYVFDTLLMACGIQAAFRENPPATGPWLLYAPIKNLSWPLDRCLAIAHCPQAWGSFSGDPDPQVASSVDGLPVVFSQTANGFAPYDIRFDIVANTFYFLSSWDEREGRSEGQTRRLFLNSVYARLKIPQDIVDQYLNRLFADLQSLCDRLKISRWKSFEWPQDTTYAVVLSHDVDFIPSGVADIALQGLKTVLRHLIRQRDAIDAVVAGRRLISALIRGRDPYGCVPEMIAREKELGVQASYQVAVGGRHPNDVNYNINDMSVREYLSVIPKAGFDLCLHGSFNSTQSLESYIEEVVVLSRQLGRPLGSRQHFLSFDYDILFTAQERAGIQYDMSMGFPDRPGPRAGFSYPYFPYCLREDRPYRVLQVSLFLMDVTLRAYCGLKEAQAWEAIGAALDDLRIKRGCASVVWHPIVFGGARDPGYDQLFWEIIGQVRKTGGLATDARTINEFWRWRAGSYFSFSRMSDPSSL